MTKKEQAEWDYYATIAEELFGIPVSGRLNLDALKHVLSYQVHADDNSVYEDVDFDIPMPS